MLFTKHYNSLVFLANVNWKISSITTAELRLCAALPPDDSLPVTQLLLTGARRLGMDSSDCLSQQQWRRLRDCAADRGDCRLEQLEIYDGVEEEHRTIVEEIRNCIKQRQVQVNYYLLIIITGNRRIVNNFTHYQDCNISRLSVNYYLLVIITGN